MSMLTAARAKGTEAAIVSALGDGFSPRTGLALGEVEVRGTGRAAGVGDVVPGPFLLLVSPW